MLTNKTKRKNDDVAVSGMHSLVHHSCMLDEGEPTIMCLKVFAIIELCEFSAACKLFTVNDTQTEGD